LRRDAQAPSAFSPALSVEGAQPLEQAGVMGEPRVYRGTFCTGHTPMVGSTAIQFSENTMHEFVEEYKSAHGLKHKVGPGNAKAYDPRAQAKRDAPPLPVAGCALARLGTGNKPERTQQTSSKAVGGWWNDPIFSQNAELPDVVVKPGEKGPAPASLGKSTSSQVGQYWFDPIVSNDDRDMALARQKNGIRRLLPMETNTQFALEDLPTQHRML